jgi:hypothetical protein
MPDDRAAAIKAKLAEQGLAVEEWVKNLVSTEALRPTPCSAQAAIALILASQMHVKPDPEGWTVKDYINCGANVYHSGAL